MREAVLYGSFGFGRTVPGREFKACEHTETTRPERGRRLGEFWRGRCSTFETESETYVNLRVGR
jgi:hypothetical protein